MKSSLFHHHHHRYCPFFSYLSAQSFSILWYSPHSSWPLGIFTRNSDKCFLGQESKKQKARWKKRGGKLPRSREGWDSEVWEEELEVNRGVDSRSKKRLLEFRKEERRVTPPINFYWQ